MQSCEFSTSTEARRIKVQNEKVYANRGAEEMIWPGPSSFPQNTSEIDNTLTGLNLKKKKSNVMRMGNNEQHAFVNTGTNSQ